MKKTLLLFLALLALFFWMAPIYAQPASAQGYGEASPAFAKSSSKARDILLLKAHGDSKVYAVENGRKYWLRTPEVFNSYGLSWSAISDVEDGKLSAYSDARLIKLSTDEKVYYIKKDTKRWINSLEAFNQNGFDWQAVKTVSPLDFIHYKNGADISGDISDSTGTITVEVAPSQTNIDAPAGIDFNPLWETWDVIGEKYYNSSKIDKKNMVQGAAEGAVKSLGDPYTVLFTPTESKKFSEDISGEFGGIGAELGYKNGIVIIAPLKGMPAERAGLRTGDKIVKINATSTQDMTVDDAVSLIRGEIGTKVTLTILRTGEVDLLEFTITREVIRVPTVDWNMKENGVAYIKLHNFFGTAEDDFIKALKEAKAAGMKKMVLDLRNNPGGLLDSSVNIASEFISAKKTIVTQDFGEGKQQRNFISRGGTLTEMPVVVLVNDGTASAAEILAGALRDQRNARIIGEKTFGKGSVQELVELSQGSLLKVTVSKWLTPSGKAINEVGIMPDIEVPLTEADRSAGLDPQLEKALAIIQIMY